VYKLEPERKSRGCVNVLAAIGLITLVVFGLLIIVVFAASAGGSSGSSYSRIHQVVYKLTTSRHDGNGGQYCRYGFDTTYQMPSGTSQRSVSVCENSGIAQVDQFSGSYGDYVYLSVQNDEQYAKISCEIFIDGKLAYQTFSEGQYVIASCSGSIE
jgi:hypothetical protein